jgi:hypothetical protein
VHGPCLGPLGLRDNDWPEARLCPNESLGDEPLDRPCSSLVAYAVAGAQLGSTRKFVRRDIPLNGFVLASEDLIPNSVGELVVHGRAS